MARRTLRLRNVVAPERDVIEIETAGGSVETIEIRTPDEIPPALAILVDTVIAGLAALIENVDGVGADYTDPVIEARIRRVVRGVTVDLAPETEERLTWRQRAEIVSFFGMRLAEVREGNLVETKPAATPTPTKAEPSRSKNSSRGSSDSTAATP